MKFLAYIVMLLILSFSVGAGAYVGVLVSDASPAGWASHMLSGAIAVAIPGFLVWLMQVFTKTVNREEGEE